MTHQPVMLAEVMSFLIARKRPPRFFVDGTFGRGGHTRAVLNQFPEIKVIALDQDMDAIEYGKQEFKAEIESKKLTLWHANFHEWSDVMARIKTDFGVDKVDGILLDLGVSSPQLDEAERGFSFLRSGPLDMRMNRNQRTTAADMINDYNDKKLVNLFKELGEIRNPYKAVNAIVQERKKQSIETTGHLADLIARADGWKHKGFHPATQYFLALRIAVNRELDGLAECLPEMLQSLNPHGQMIVITFHSLEDRIVKTIFKANADLGKQVHKKVIQASDIEIKNNTRSRSAKLRVFEAGIADDQGDDEHDEHENTH